MRDMTLKDIAACLTNDGNVWLWRTETLGAAVRAARGRGEVGLSKGIANGNNERSHEDEYFERASKELEDDGFSSPSSAYGKKDKEKNDEDKNASLSTASIDVKQVKVMNDFSNKDKGKKVGEAKEKDGMKKHGEKKQGDKHGKKHVKAKSTT